RGFRRHGLGFDRRLEGRADEGAVIDAVQQVLRILRGSAVKWHRVCSPFDVNSRRRRRHHTLCLGGTGYDDQIPTGIASEDLLAKDSEGLFPPQSVTRTSFRAIRMDQITREWRFKTGPPLRPSPCRPWA